MTTPLTWFNPPDRERLLISEAEAHDRRLRAMGSQVNSSVARNTAQIADQYPTLDREVIAAASLAGVPADDPILLDVAMRSWEADQNLWDMAIGAVKGTTRIAGTIAQSFYEELVSRPIRTVVGTLQGMSLGDAFGEAGSSVGVRALQELTAGRRVNLGSGFLPGNDVATPDDPAVQKLVEFGVDEFEAIRTVQSQYGAPIYDQFIADSERIKFRGQPVSPGRLAAGVFGIEPGTLPYNVFSGAIDGISQVLLDPASKLFVGFKIPKLIPGVGGQFVKVAGRELKGISNVRADLRKIAGISPSGSVRNTVYSPMLNNFIDGLRGQQLLDALWVHRGDPVTLAKIFSRGGAASPPSKIINEIGRPGLTRADLSSIMKGQTGIDITVPSRPGEVLSTLRETGGLGDEGLTRLRQLGPDRIERAGVDVPDVLQALPRDPTNPSLIGRGLQSAGVLGEGQASSLGGAIAGSLGPGLSRALKPLGGAPVTPELGRVLGLRATVGHSIDGTRLGRLFATMPGRQLDFKDLDSSAATLDDWMIEAKFSFDKRQEIMAKWHNLNDSELVNADFYELVFKDVQQEFSRQIVRDVVPRSVAAKGKEAIDIWKAGGGGASGKDNAMVQMLEENLNFWFDDLDEMRRYFTADMANQPFPGSRFKVLGDGSFIEQPTAQLLAEYLNRGVTLPEPRLVRRAVSRISEAVANDALELRALPGVFDVYMQKIWKPMVLLRVAFPLRVQADNQLRMAAAGLDSMFRHPMDWLSWAIADPTLDGSIQKILRGAAKVLPESRDGVIGFGRTSRGATGVKAREITDEFGEVIEIFDSITGAKKAKDAMTHGGSSLLGYSSSIENPGDVVYTLLANSAPGEAAPGGFMSAWLTEYLQLGGDDVARRVAANKEEAKEWFWGNRAVREALADTDAKKVIVDDAVAQAEGYANAKAAADTYIEGVWARIVEKSGGKFKAQRLEDGRVVYTPVADGNTDLVRGIANGKLKVDGNDIDLATVGNARYSSLIDEFTNTYYDEWSPSSVKVHDETRVTRGLPTSADRIVKRMFEALASKPENLLSRSPAFRQFYWQRVEELMPFMDDATRNQTLRAARAANLDRTALQRFAKKAIEGTGDGISAIDDVENIAMSFALDNTRELLYDLHKRSNFMDIARNLFPFGEAWVEIITRWSKLAYDHPETLRRFQQVVEGGRRSGFITTDPVSGKEVFNYPGGGLLANWMLKGASPAGPVAGALGGAALGGAVAGLPGAVVGGFGGTALGAFAGGIREPKGGSEASLAIQGQVAGINLVAASYLPGLGPLIQAPLAVLMGNNWVMSRPQFDWVKDQIFPFGDPQLNSPDDFLKLGLPAWSKKIIQPLASGDPDFARLHAHSTIDVMRALLQTPGYSKDSPEQMLRLVNDGKKIATNLSIIRGFLQFGLPTGPSIRFYAAAKTDDPATNGTFYLFQTLASEYRKMLEEKNFDEVAATDQFFAAFGLDPVDFITSKTTSAFRRGATTEAFDFERQNLGIFERFPLTAYYGAPDDPDAEFNLEAWARQLDEGTREPFTEEQWLGARHHTLGSAAYAEAQREIQGKRAARGEENIENYNEREAKYLRDVKLWLMEEYPGYNRPNVGVPTKGSIEQKVAELIGWADNPVLSETSAGRGLAVYLEARQTVIDRVVSLDFSPTSYQSAKLDGRGVRYRRFLRETAEWIIAQPQYADFGPMWLSILSRELKDDIDAETGAVAA